ncbi:hypothetical protein ABFX02_04G135700 [Erythranthe guttata]
MGRIEKVEGGASSHQHHNNNNNNEDEEDIYAPPPPTIITNEKSKLPPQEEQFTSSFPHVHHEYDHHLSSPSQPLHPHPEKINNNHQPQNLDHLYQPETSAFSVDQPAAHPLTPPAPFTPPIPPIPDHEWKTHLFDCMSDPQNAIITFCFPCVTFGQIAEILDDGRTSCGTSGMLYTLIAVCAMPCLITCSYRSKMRAKFELIESPAPDCLIHCFCEYCALCQEYRELTERGIDPSIGYYGNVAKMQKLRQQMGMAAPMQQRMI